MTTNFYLSPAEFTGFKKYTKTKPNNSLEEICHDLSKIITSDFEISSKGKVLEMRELVLLELTQRDESKQNLR